ncbi:hypothetical protein [Chryseobacterium vrystaatense]|uniref:DUF4625 domain-containing protein n=1 Tax=Chryseobacterium vrystaatense TaxID=307480 RepID=A0A1M5KFD9_9FLAO|nr:hypothetical protein [Chryseobacterium vrystaatense]SHG51644.1 hypothetical protein SAMN02787073_4358 [Chryseobacterium vrystaatense]
MKNFNSISLLTLLIFFISCRSDDHYTRIEITSPVNNQTFTGNTTVEVKAKIYDDGDSIMNEELLITLNNSTDTTPILDFKDTEFCFEYNLSKNFVAEAGKEYKIEIKAKGGHGNWTKKLIIIKCK